MIKMVSLKCPECGANLTIEERYKQCFCQYCGTKIVIDDGSTTHTYRKIDEARIKEAELNAAVRLKELELEEKKHAGQINKSSVLMTVIKIIGSILLGIIGASLIFAGILCAVVLGEEGAAFYVLAIIGVLAFGAILFIWKSKK